jgi:hypothetical protein
MAMKEVIHFLFRAQLYARRLILNLSPPEPVAESPPS